jgi:hypothetical protein
MLVCSVFAAFAVPAFAQAASITVDQATNPGCIDPDHGAVSGTFTGMPTGFQYYPGAVAVSAHPHPGDDVVPSYGGEYSERVDSDGIDGGQLNADGSGTFMFNLTTSFGSNVPDTLWIKARVHDSLATPDGDQWVPFAEVEVPVCGSDPDTDGDGIVDSVDNCDSVINPGQENNDGDAQGDVCDADDENDGVNDDVDNCQFTPNPSQENNDLDAQGDACDADDDNDGVNDGGDNCQFTANPGQRDDDHDGIGDACDGTFDSSDGKSSGGGWLETSDGKVNFSSSAKSVDGVLAGNCVVTVDQTKIKCLTVDGYHQSSTGDRAVFVGTATQDGVTRRYRIELTDNGEPGTSDHVEITTDAGFAAAGVIGAGNLQVHRGA